MTNDQMKLQLQVIDFLRFPMAIAVVVLHYGATFCTKSTGLVNFLFVVFSNGVCRLAVPFFFFASGFLFFYRLWDWDWNLWREKIKRRVRTLLVPYLLWNAIAFFCFYLWYYLHGGENSLLQQFANYGGIKIFWNASLWGGEAVVPLTARAMPIDGPLWFIRDLMYYSLLTPFFYLFVKKLKLYGVIAVCFFSIAYPGLIPDGFVFFLLGSFFQLTRKNFLMFKSKRYYIYILTLLLLVAYYFFYDTDYWSKVIRFIFLFLGIYSSICLSERALFNGIQINSFLTKGSFFIFATHNILILASIATPIVRRILPFSGQLWESIHFVLIPALTVLICLSMLLLAEWGMPRTTSILTGARSTRQRK